MTEQQSLATRPKPSLTLATVVEMTGFAAVDIALVSKTVAQGAPLQELAVFLHTCRALKLDPLLRQAYWIRRKSRQKVGNEWQDVWKGTLQVGIDGFRAIAEGSGVYAGAEPPEYRGELEWTYKTRKLFVPERARVIVWKIVQGHKGAFTGEAYWSEFVPSEDSAQMWAKMPRLMLAKCAEAQALRKAFPTLLTSVDMDAERYSETTDEAELELVNPPEETQPEPELPKRRPRAEDYDRIFPPDEIEGPSQPPPSPPPAERQAPPEPSADDTERSLLWQRNRELSQDAARLKIRAPVQRSSVTNSQLDEANTDLQRLIAQELDKVGGEPA